jgi:glucokinase
MKYIGIDLGGTNIAVGVVSGDGTITRKKSAPTEGTREGTLIAKDMAALCKELIAEEGGEFRSVGVGVPCTIEQETGVVRKMANINFVNFPLRGELQRLIGLPVFLGNDADCAALGENVSGAAKGSKISLTITLGTGIGSGVIIDGKILDAAFSNGGEAGHHIIVYNGRQCGCGRKGCWERYASVSALIYDAKDVVKENPESLMATLAQNGEISGRVVFKAAKLGDSAAIALIDRYLKYVACGVANMICVFDPNTVVIGGGVSEQGDVILDPIRRYVAGDVYGGVLRANIVAATLGNDAGIIGAAMLGRL